ncbi:MAG: hypothetical protein ACJ8D2_06935, partial [Sphingomicrobium sp.]
GDSSLSYGEEPRRASVGNIIAGVILILGAILCLLLGGGCTVLLFYAGGTGGGITPEIWPMLLISLAILGAGVGGMWIGFRLILGKYD